MNFKSMKSLQKSRLMKCNKIPAGGLNGAALKGSVDERSVFDITRSSRLFTPEIPAVRT